MNPTHVRARFLLTFAAMAVFAAAGAAAAAPASGMPAWVEAEVDAAYGPMTELRHALHQAPKLGNQEVKTQERILVILKDAGIETVTGWK